MTFETLYRSDELLVLNKPGGLSMLADRSGAECLWDRLPALLGPGSRPLPVHRLDKGTSGVLLVALERRLQGALNRAFAARHVDKFYVARVVGEPDLGGRTGLIDLPLMRGRKSRYRVAAPRAAIERHGNVWRVANAAAAGLASQSRMRLHQSGARSVLAMQPVTGRTHQLRVHLAWIGHPICGDHLYGRPDAAEQRWPRLALHCHRIVAHLPDRTLTFTAPLPADF
jgi:23S rRNA-/tRNA-specific pseudouridylate synthase